MAALMYTNIVLFLCLVFSFLTQFGIAAGRGGIAKLPADKQDEATARVERKNNAWNNQRGQMVCFLPLMYLISSHFGDLFGACLGLLFFIGSVWYITGYTAAFEKRAHGFTVYLLCMLIAILMLLYCWGLIFWQMFF